MISCSKCKKATLPVSDGGCIRTGGIVDIGCEYGEPRILTNYDRIVSKSPEELAVVIAWPYLASPPWCSEHTTCPYISEDPTPCDKCALDWLKQPVEEEGET